MREFKASTKRGQSIIARAEAYEGVFLSDVYGSYSVEKAESWNKRYDMFMMTDEHSYFHICSYNTFQYSVAWYGKKDGENILRLETVNNSFLVWLDR